MGTEQPQPANREQAASGSLFLPIVVGVLFIFLFVGGGIGLYFFIRSRLPNKRQSPKPHTQTRQSPHQQPVDAPRRSQVQTKRREKVERLLKWADEALQRGDLLSAVSLLERACATCPERSIQQKLTQVRNRFTAYEAALRKAEAAQKQNDIKTAIRFYKEALKVNPPSKLCRVRIKMLVTKLAQMKHRVVEPIKTLPASHIVCITDDGKTAAMEKDGTVVIFNLEGKRTTSFALPDTRGEVLALDGRGTLLAAGCRDRAVHIWRKKDGEWRAVVVLHTFSAWVDVVAVSPDGAFLVAATSDESLIHVFRTSDWEEVATRKAHKGGVLAAVFSPDGKRLVTAGKDRLVVVWNTTTWKEEAILRCGNISATRLAFSPDGSHLAVALGSWMTIWNTKDWKKLKRKEGHTRSIESLSFSPDGKMLASVGLDERLCIWEWDDELRRIVKKTGTHIGGATFVKWLKDRRIVTAGWDGKIRVWRLR